VHLYTLCTIIKQGLPFVIGVTFMGSFTSSTQARESALSFSFDALVSDETIRLSDHKGNVILIVNTASKCGFTSQYTGLEQLYQKYKESGFVVIGVPSNDFGRQEPGIPEEIIKFCEFSYGVSFPMTAKYCVKGKDAHPFYQWAKKELGFITVPKWNFHKYLIDRHGKLVDYFHSTTKPDADRLISSVKLALQDK
jgi:glutathione peroxidase